MSIWIVFGLVLVVLMALAGAYLLGRRAQDTGDVSSIPVESTEAQSTEITDQLAMVPLPGTDNLALLLGSDISLEAFDKSGLAMRSPRNGSGPLPQVVRRVLGASGAGGTGLTQRGIDSGRLVELSDDTMKALKAGAPAYDKAGKMLGLVRGERGIKHVMRLKPATATSASCTRT